jgi:hypothetical protein
MVRPIDANALITAVLKKAIDDAFLNGNTDMHRLLVQVVTQQPTIDAVPERTGVWSEEYDPDEDPFFRRKFRCSACNGWNTYGFTRYCPECGAKMMNATALTMEVNNDEIH